MKSPHCGLFLFDIKVASIYHAPTTIIRKAPRMLVEKKLKGVFSNVDVTVPWEAFDDYIDALMEYLDDYEIQKTRLEVCENPLVIKAFEDSIDRLIDDLDFNELGDMVDDDTIRFAFRPELDELDRIENEKRAEEALRIAEENRIAAEVSKAQRELEALTEVQITINKKHLNKAIALLQAAGLMKKAK
jgi:hypothetical protein